MTEQEIVMMAAEVAAKAAVAAVRAILGKEIQESVEAAVTDAARLGAEASIKAVEQERKKFRDGRSDRRFRNTKLLLRNYTVLNANCSHAVYDAASAATGEESVEEIVEALDELKEQGEMALTGFDDWELDALKVTYDHIEDLLNEDFSDTGKSEPNSYTMTFTLPEEVHEAMDKYIDENPAGKVELAQLLVNKAKGLI